eukprot:11835472-Alexandrium_andersonii.AAC.1
MAGCAHAARKAADACLELHIRARCGAGQHDPAKRQARSNRTLASTRRCCDLLRAASSNLDN